ncbi:hypothetical protein SDC9_212049 [bioreactor metagenome]|uniref:Uncharacterized protein n=1 Tax=bioreactor metagenome TaxID=1076179 RepID=A0A645JKS4_9ZZZZ
MVHHTENERQVWVPWVLRPIVLRQINIDKLITHEFKLEDVKEAFNVVCNNQEAIKVMLKP